MTVWSLEPGNWTTQLVPPLKADDEVRKYPRLLSPREKETKRCLNLYNRVCVCLKAQQGGESRFPKCAVGKTIANQEGERLSTPSDGNIRAQAIKNAWALYFFIGYWYNSPYSYS